MKNLVTFTFLIIGFLFIYFPNKTFALTQQAISQNVDITINKDSTFNVTETAEYTFNGEFHGLRRDITLVDSASLAICEEQGLTCGGFDHIEVTNVTKFDGTQIPFDDLNFYTTEKNGSTYYRVEWEIFPDGKDVSNYKVGWIINYVVFGGIQEVENRPYFYWDLLPEDRGGVTQTSKINITFPDGVKVNEDNLQVLTSLPFTDILIRGAKSDTLTINLKNIASYGAITLTYPFQKGEVKLPGKMNYQITNPPLGGNLYLDGYLVAQNSTSGTLRGITPGDHTLEIARTGFNTITEKFSIKESESIDRSYNLEQSFLLSLIDKANQIFFGLGIFFIPLFIILAYRHLRKRGKDVNMPKTIIPEFTPPEGVRPYLLGSLKDESVDKEDIAGTIIDLAYRGYLKIKEKEQEKVLGITVGQKEYELIRTDKKDGLDKIEGDILQAIFNGKESTTTKEMIKTFPYKYNAIVSSIYKEMVTKGYFKESPQSTIAKYVGFGIFLLAFSVVGLFILSGILTELLGYFTVFTIALPFAILGLALAIFAKFMPAKTEIGSQVYAKILGFKMYLHTAERFRLQNLGPEEFEKYLSYAIVFKIEDEWAKKFEGLYDKAPDWYEGSNVNAIYNAYFFSSFARSFTTTTTTAFNFPTQSSSGSGWSGGGGSFGGFSGGGGGGGSSGGW